MSVHFYRMGSLFFGGWLAAVASAAAPNPGNALAPAADSITIEELGDLTSQFPNRYVTGLEYAGTGMELPEELRAMLQFSPDGLHMAFVLDLVTARTVIIDGIRGKPYDHVSGGVFSPEQGHFAYFASPCSAGGLALVLDGREYPVPDDLIVDSPILLSRTGRHFAYLGRPKSRFRSTPVLITDLPMKDAVDVSDGFHRIEDLEFSWDESRLLDTAWGQVFDLSGSHVAYAYRDHGWYYVMQDGTAGVGHAQGARVVGFSRDGEHFAYVASDRTGEEMLMVDGVPGRPYEEIIADTSFFDPERTNMSYWARRDGKWYRVVDEHEVRALELEGSGKNLMISGDGNHVAYVDRGTRSRVVLDGIPERDYDLVGLPRLSPRGGHVAYAARRDNVEMVVVDRSEGPTFEAVGDPVFSPDGEHVAYAAWIREGRICVVVDGRQGPEFDAVMPNGPWFHPDGTLEYLSLRGSVLLRVRHVMR